MQLVNNFRVRLLVRACVVVLLLVGVSAFGDTIYVEEGASGAGSSWADAYGSLQDALDDAVSGDEIWVAAGTYYPDPDRRNNPRRACFQMINGVAVYGGFDGTETALEERDAGNNETILSGDIGVADDGSDNCLHVFYHPEGTDLNASAILDGFTITEGNANGSGYHRRGGGMCNIGSSPTVTDCTFSGNSASRGGGMGNFWGSSPTVTSCTFTDNLAGGGMHNGENSSPTVTDCTFNGNSAGIGGGVCNDSSSPTVRNCTFSGNSADLGGGMYNIGSSLTVADCTFNGNSAEDDGGGMYNWGGSLVVSNCTFSGNSAGYGGGGMFNYSSSPTVSNCTFSGNSADSGGGMHNWWGSRSTVTNCTFSGNLANYGGGVFNRENSSPTVTNCILWGNTASNGNEVYNETSMPLISYCDIAGCGGSGGGWDGALGNDGGGNTDVDPAFVDVDGADNTVGTEDDNLRLSADSVCVDAGDSTAVTEVTDLDGQPRIMDGDGNGTATVDMGAYEHYGVAYEPVVIYVDADAAGGDNDGLSWEDAFTSLQDGLDAVVIGDEIWVAAGTYYPDPDRRNNPRRACFQMINGVAIYGGFDGTETALDQRDAGNNETILSGDIGVSGEISDNCYHVFYHSAGTNLDATAILDGFTIAGGNADGSRNHGVGGGMYNGFSSPTVINCTFVGNSAYYDGGGMFNVENSSPTVTNCTFNSNSADGGGGMSNYYCSPTVTNCIFTDNSANFGGGMSNNHYSNPIVTNCTFSGNSASDYGGGMNNYGSIPTVTACTFSGNLAEDGGGMYNRENSSSTVINCTFSGNSADDGGGMFNYYSSPTVTNCTFSGNSASNGGGMYNFLYSGPTVTNCTFSGNSAYYDGGGMYNWKSRLIVTNCTFAGNTAENGNGLACDSLYQPNPSIIKMINCIVWDGGSEIWNNDGSTITIVYSDVQGDWLGLGNNNIDADPLFVDADGADGIFGTEDDDLRLLVDSVCIDAGDNGAVTVATDLDGQPRIIDGDGDGIGVVDMGAYEMADPVALLDFLYQDIIDMELQQGIENRLLAKLDTAISKLEDDNEKNDATAINSLEAFINAVQAQSGKKISEEEAEALIAAAEQIIEISGTE